MHIKELKNKSLDEIQEFIADEKHFYYWNRTYFNIEVYILTSFKFSNSNFELKLVKDNDSIIIDLFNNFITYNINDNITELINSLYLSTIQIDKIPNKSKRIEVQTKIDILSKVYPEAFI